MVDDEEVLAIRKRLHDMSDHVQGVALKVAVIETRQESAAAQLTRIETAVTGLPAKVAVLEARVEDAATSGAKWGAGLGAFVAALISGVAAFFGGPK